MSENTFKGLIHVVAANLFCVMTAYNLMRLFSTGKTKNAINLSIYGSITLWEWKQVHSHWSNGHGTY